MFLHGDAVEAVGDFHRLFVVGDHQDLGVADGLLDETVEEPDVRVVERRVDLVQQEEGDGAVEEDGEDERDRRHGFLAAGEERDALGPLPGDPDFDVDTRFEEVVLVGQAEFRAAAGEEAGEDLLEALVDPFEGLRKPFPGDGVDPCDGRLKGRKRGVEIGDLGGEEFVTGLQLLMFVQGQEVDLAEGTRRPGGLFPALRRVPRSPRVRAAGNR